MLQPPQGCAPFLTTRKKTMDLNKLPSRFAIGDKVIAGKHQYFSDDITDLRQWHDYSTGESIVTAVVFRPGKVAYMVTNPQGREQLFDSCDVEPAPVIGGVSADQAGVPDGYVRHDGFVKCGVAGLADDCATVSLEKQFAHVATAFDRELNMHTVGL